MKSKGAQYSKIFRKAGIAWGKGDVQKAIAILGAGLSLAAERGDTDVVQVLQRDLERYQRLAAGAEMDLWC
jgi:hypothetical protein